MTSESVVAKSVNQRIGVSGIATAFRIISRFCLNRIWLEELNQLCPKDYRDDIGGEFRAQRPERCQFSPNAARHLSTLGFQWCEEIQAGPLLCLPAFFISGLFTLTIQ